MLNTSNSGFLANPYPALAALREQSAAVYDEHLDRWLITRHADVRVCLRDRRLGRNFRHVGTDDQFKAKPHYERWDAFLDVEQWSLLWLEPPDHTRIRKLVAGAFTPRSVEALRAPAREMANALLTPLVARGSMEVLNDFAQPYSIALICRLLGVPADRGQDMVDWSHRMVKMYELDVSHAHASAANSAAAEFRGWIAELLELRRQQPADDMISRLANVNVDGERLTDGEIISTIIVLLNAGHEATVNTLGNGLLALTRHPKQWARLREGSVSASAAIEELIRYDPPLQLFERWVLTDDFHVAGTQIPRGEKIAMLFGAANHDPRVFEHPDIFDVGRVNAHEHIGFGGGIHACIGAPLARLELEEALTSIVEHVKQLSLGSEPERTGSFVIWGLNALHLNTAS